MPMMSPPSYTRPAAMNGARSLGRDELLRLIGEKLSRFLGTAPEQIDLDLKFTDLGTDSLTAVQMKEELESELGRKFRSTLLLDHPTVGALCDFILGQNSPPAPVSGAKGTESHAFTSSTNDVAIVGAACRLPGGVRSLEDYWQLLVSERDAVKALDVTTIGGRTELLDESLPQLFAGLIDEPFEFDERLFSTSPVEAVEMDPQQRVLLHTCWEALENAGVSPRSTKPRRGAVFVGARGSEYHDMTSARGEAAYQGTGASLAALAGRVSYCLGLTGPSMTIDTACSSSLVALHYATEEVRRRDSDFAIAAGVNLLLSSFAMRATHAANMLAPDGRCKAFSSEADGYVRSEGSVVLVLRRLDRALADGDQILGLIKGSAVNQDGPSSGLTVPRAEAQVEVIRQAWGRAQVGSPSSAEYVECHGTGTELGDPIEVQALHDSMIEPRREPLLIGSVKSQLGHTEPAAGLAGVLKVLLAYRHSWLPKTLHCDSGLNAHLGWEELGIEPVLRSTPWPKNKSNLAGVSSFGFTGTNAHVVLSRAPEVRGGGGQSRSEPWPILTLSAQTPKAFECLCRAWMGWLAERDREDVSMACRLSNLSRSALPYRGVFRGWSAEELLSGLRQSVESVPPRKVRNLLDPNVISLCAKDEDWIRYEEHLAPSWPAFAEALDARQSSIVELTNSARESQNPMSQRLRSLAVACALGDALQILGLRPQTWSGQGIGASAAQVLGGCPLERALIAFMSGGRANDSIEEEVPSASRGDGRGSSSEFRCISVSATPNDLVQGHRLLPQRDALLGLATNAYLAGAAINWLSLHRERGGTPGCLPNYPFDSTRYSRAGVDRETKAISNASSVDPVVSRVSSVDEAQVKFQVSLDPRSQEWLTEHRVEGMPILPASGVLSLVHRAALEAFQSERILVENLELKQAISLGTRRTLDLKFVFNNERDAAEVELSTTGPEDHDGPRNVAFCRVKAAVDPEVAIPFARLTDREGSSKLSRVYSALEAAGITHGPRFRTLTALRADSKRVWVRSEVEEKTSFARSTIGLDACFITSAAILHARGDETPRIPVGCDSCLLLSKPSEDLFAEVSLQSEVAAGNVVRVNLQIQDAHGELVAQIRGLRLAARPSRTTLKDIVQTLRWDWQEGALPVPVREDASKGFMLIGDDRQFLERLGSVFRGVHQTEAHCFDVQGEGSPDLQSGRNFVFVNRHLSGPEFLTRALPAMKEAHSRAASVWFATNSEPCEAQRELSFASLSRAVVRGFGYAIQHEQPKQGWGVVDLSAELSVETQCELLAAELRRNPGELRVRYQGGGRQVPRLKRVSASAHLPVALRVDASYLVTGGCSGLGRLAALHLARRGAGHVVVLSRSAQGANSLQEEVEALGVRFSSWRIDVADRDSLQTLLSDLGKSAPPLRGILHAAGSIRDATLGHLSSEDLGTVLAPKVQGAWNLHQATRHCDLDFFVSYSSLGTTLGSPGQSSYCGANAFLEELAEARVTQGMSAVAVAWGPWSEVGMASRVQGQSGRLELVGVRSMTPDEGMEQLDAALGERGVLTVAKIQWDTYCTTVDPRLTRWFPGQPADTSLPPGEMGARVRERGSSESAAALLADYLRERITEVAGSEVISDEDSFFELGLDSLQAVAMRNRVERDLGVELSASLLFDYPTVADLSAHILGEHFGIATPVPSSAPVGAAPQVHFSTLVAEPSSSLSYAVADLEASMELLEAELDF